MSSSVSKIGKLFTVLLMFVLFAGITNEVKVFAKENQDEDMAVFQDTLIQAESEESDDSIVTLSEGSLVVSNEQQGDITDQTGSSDSAGKIESSADSVNIVKNQVVVTNKFPFYRKWWFSLLIVLLIIPFVYRQLIKREKILKERLNDYDAKINEYIRQVKEKEEQLIKQETEFKEKLIEEEELKYQAVGLSKFSEIMSNNKEELGKVGQSLIFELVKYLGVNMAALYIVKEDNYNEQVLELLSAYAPDIKQMQSKIHPGEGFIGACFNEGSLMEITDIPETYTKISSGLGEALPRYLAFIPLRQDETKLGVIEIASFRPLEKYKLEFVDKLSQNIASYIAIRQANAVMQEMIERSQAQAEELQAQEEELRQNLEEMQATQEELQRQMEKNKIIQEELQKEQYLVDALMNNIPEYIYFKDLDSKFIKNSRSHARIFGYSDPKEIVGKSDFDFFDDEHARPAYEAEQNIIKTGKPIIDLIEKEVRKDGTVSWVSTTKMPLYNHEGKIVGTFGISKDITEIKKLEMEAQQKTEELLAQEEELRQNLEEMQTVQEELQRQKEELAKEKALMDALLHNATESIYFKDEKSRFIKASDSMARLFHVKSVEELYGKTDFDFFTEEHARPAFEDEMNIIKTGRPIINKIEKETHPDGRVTYVSTSKMPLYNQEGKIIGTFGISKDITEMKKLEMETQQKTEELLAQEEELRQNLEEMQTVQEELQRRIDENEKIKKQYLQREKELKTKIEKLEKELRQKR